MLASVGTFIATLRAARGEFRGSDRLYGVYTTRPEYQSGVRLVQFRNGPARRNWTTPSGYTPPSRFVGSICSIGGAPNVSYAQCAECVRFAHLVCCPNNALRAPVSDDMMFAHTKWKFTLKTKATSLLFFFRKLNSKVLGAALAAKWRSKPIEALTTYIICLCFWCITRLM